eukprot:3350117-Pyramimonas_sp.AAC.1
MVLAVALRTLKVRRSVEDSQCQRPRKGVWARCRDVRARQSRRVSVLKSLNECSDRIQDRHGAAVTVIRGVEVPEMMFWYSSGFSNVCPPPGHSPQC